MRDVPRPGAAILQRCEHDRRWWRLLDVYGGEQCKAAGGVVVWIDNSLDDKFTPETMIAVAKSLVPARRAPA